MAGKTSGTPSKARTQRLVLWAGLICGLVAAVLVFVIVAQAGDEEKGDRSVVVAKLDIPAQSRLIADMLEVKTLPADEIDPEAFTARSQVVDRITGVAIAAGEHILPSMVSNRAGDSLTFKISPGKRAVSIEVKEAVTAGGNVQPGDTVDVVGIFDLGQDADIASVLAVFAPGTEPVVTPMNTDTNTQLNLTTTILEGVTVLAVGQSLAESEEKTTTTATKPETDAESRPKAKSVTLEVTPQQAQLLSLADEYGVLRLSVRPFGDYGPVGVAPVITALER
jgi:pilus assembly protein CpaB